MNWDVLGGWVAAGLTLFLFSFLYRDNPLFKFAEHLFLGVGVGYLLTLNIFEVLATKVWTPLMESFARTPWDSGVLLTVAVPTLFGLLILTRFVPQAAWLSRWTFALIVGFGSGIWIPRATDTYILQQMQGTVRPLLHRPEGGFSAYGLADLGTDLSNGLVIAGVLSILIYFFYSIEHKGPVRKISRLGTLFLMVAFGASFGNTVMSRMSLLYGRCLDLYTYSGPDYGYATPVLLCTLVVVMAVWTARSRRAGADQGH